MTTRCARSGEPERVDAEQEDRGADRQADGPDDRGRRGRRRLACSVRRAMARTRRRSGAVRSQASAHRGEQQEDERDPLPELHVEEAGCRRTARAAARRAGRRRTPRQSAVGLLDGGARDLPLPRPVGGGHALDQDARPVAVRAAGSLPTSVAVARLPSFGSPSGALLSASRSTQSLRSRTVFSWRARRGALLGVATAEVEIRGGLRPVAVAARPEEAPHRAARRRRTRRRSSSARGGDGRRGGRRRGLLGRERRRAAASSATGEREDEPAGDVGAHHRCSFRTGTGARPAPPARATGCWPGAVPPPAAP